jgi:hypothetical protein
MSTLTFWDYAFVLGTSFGVGVLVVCGVLLLSDREQDK